MHWQGFYGGPVVSPISAGIAGVMFLVLILWTVVWKGMALWKAAREGSKVWFVILLVVNTVGILDILYIYFFSKKPVPPVEGPKM